SSVYGPYRPGELDPTGWWTPPVFGEAIGLEFIADDREGDPPLPKFLVVSHVNQLRPPVLLGVCAQDAACVPAWLPQADGVALITFETAGGIGQCTASLINRVPSDQSPLLLTARHCIDQQSLATTLSVYWFFRATICNGV